MQTGFCGCTADSGGTTGFWWYIYRILLVHFERYQIGILISLFFCGKCHDWRTVDGLKLVMHNIVFHCQKCWSIFCGRSMLKHVRSVTGMASWWRLVTYYSCFMLWNVYLCLHFTSKRDHLHCIVITSSLLLVSGSYYRFMMLNRYTGLCWFITTDSVILDCRSRGVKIPRAQFQYLIRRLFVRSRESRSREICVYGIRCNTTESVVSYGREFNL